MSPSPLLWLLPMLWSHKHKQENATATWERSRGRGWGVSPVGLQERTAIMHDWSVLLYPKTTLSCQRSSQTLSLSCHTLRKTKSKEQAWGRCQKSWPAGLLSRYDVMTSHWRSSDWWILHRTIGTKMAGRGFSKMA